MPKIRYYPKFCSDFVKLPYCPSDQDIRVNYPTCRVVTLLMATLLKALCVPLCSQSASTEVSLRFSSTPFIGLQRLHLLQGYSK